MELIGSMESVFSVDVEDWFHILEVDAAPRLDDWTRMPSRVERNFHDMLALFAEAEVRVTCFFLGWVAERFPELVRAAVAGGHEIASHGYAHRLVYRMSPQDLLEDIRKAKAIIEDAGGRRVKGYRCPGFSVTRETPWFFEKVVEAGHVYDSSVFPALRGHGGLEQGQVAPHVIDTPAGALSEFPITVARVLGKPMCFFGGGYLRLFPYRVIREMAERVLREGRPVVFYIHPREIDPGHPRIPMRPARRFKSYVGLRSAPAKLRRILSDFKLTTFESLVERQGESERHDSSNRQRANVEVLRSLRP